MFYFLLHFLGNINESVGIGIRPILQVFANDFDLHTPTQLIFSISINSPFRINNISGEVFTIAILDADTVGLYSFEVFVTDSDVINPLFASAEIVITVLDENDNEPLFSENSFSVNISESVPSGHNVIVVTATDGDSGKFRFKSFYWEFDIS